VPDVSSTFLLIFIVALGLTLVTFVLGVTDVGLPGHGAGGGDLSVPDTGGLDGAADVMGHGAGGGHGLGHDAAGGASPFNMATMLAFLTWFGGAGYLLTEHFGVGTIAALIFSAGIGVIGGAIVFFFLARVLLRGQTPYLRSEDYSLEGTIGRLSVGIRSGRTGEVVYSKAGTRRVASARSADGEDIAQGAEVVVISQEGGIAYVRRFEELLAEEPRVAARN
jgi:membrane protein implicated in regulation of membrane protease activity